MMPADVALLLGLFMNALAVAYIGCAIQRRNKEERERQDAVAEKVEEVAARLLVENKKATESSKANSEKLDEIHDLVNSNFEKVLEERDKAEKKVEAKATPKKK